MISSLTRPSLVQSVLLISCAFGPGASQRSTPGLSLSLNLTLMLSTSSAKGAFFSQLLKKHWVLGLMNLDLNPTEANTQ